MTSNNMHGRSIRAALMKERPQWHYGVESDSMHRGREEIAHPFFFSKLHLFFHPPKRLCCLFLPCLLSHPTSPLLPAPCLPPVTLGKPSVFGVSCPRLGSQKKASFSGVQLAQGQKVVLQMLASCGGGYAKLEQQWSMPLAAKSQWFLYHF